MPAAFEVDVDNMPIGQRDICESWIIGGQRHTLLINDPGMGKSKLLQWLAGNSNSKTIVGRCTPLDIISTILAKDPETGKRFEGTLIIDELHNMTPKDQEVLLPLLEEGCIWMGDELFPCPHIVILAATTEPDRLIQPLKDRFAWRPYMQPYRDKDIVAILEAHPDYCDFPEDDIEMIASIAGGVPRKALTLAKDILEVGRDLALSTSGYKANGLTRQQQEYLSTLASMGGTAGAASVKNSMGRTSAKQIGEIEGALTARGYIKMHSSGRKLTGKGALAHLNCTDVD